MSRASFNFWWTSQLWFQNCFFNWPTVKTQLSIYKNKYYTYRKKRFFKLCFKVCSKWICEYVTTRNYKNIFRRYFMRGFQKKTQKHKWQQAYFRVHFVFSWFWSLVWCRMLALLSWTPIPTVSINVCSPHPPPCMMLCCPLDWLGVQWETRISIFRHWICRIFVSRHF